MSSLWTVVGGRGFVGSALARHLEATGERVIAPRHADLAAQARAGEVKGSLGHVVYCSGVASDAARRPLDAFEAHVGSVLDLLRTGAFESFTYVSSTRVYGEGGDTAETATLSVRPEHASGVYALSKIAGESACLTQADPRVRVVRLSNVAGPSFDSALFLPDVLRQAVHGRIAVRTGAGSAKDYIAVEDVVALITAVATGGRERIYNVASGCNVTHGEILGALQACSGAEVVIPEDAPEPVTPPIETSRIREEFAFRPLSVPAMLPGLYAAFGLALDGRSSLVR